MSCEPGMRMRNIRRRPRDVLSTENRGQPDGFNVDAPCCRAAYVRAGSTDHRDDSEELPSAAAVSIEEGVAAANGKAIHTHSRAPDHSAIPTDDLLCRKLI